MLEASANDDIPVQASVEDDKPARMPQGRAEQVCVGPARPWRTYPVASRVNPHITRSSPKLHKVLRVVPPVFD
jgi:hypothetical protein